jgi:hypothetical protein
MPTRAPLSHVSSITGLSADCFCSVDTIMQTIMGIKAPAMCPRPARDQLQWPVQEARPTVRFTSCGFFAFCFLSNQPSLAT